MKTLIFADKSLLKSDVKGPGYLEIMDGTSGNYTKDEPQGDVKITRKEGKWITPDLVDAYIHGYMNHDVTDNDVKGIKVMSEGLLSCGVTPFLPTTLTSSKERLTDVAHTTGQVCQEVSSAKIQGICFEGPFFTEEHKGAQNPSYFRDPDLDTLHEQQEASGGIIKKTALAPGRNGVEESIETVTDEGVVVALGHSNATLEEADAAVKAGASVFVHAYNGVRGLNHREPEMVDVSLTLQRVFSELICSRHYVYPQAAEVLMEKADRDHAALTTDCMAVGGMPDGNYNLGEFPVVVAEGTARLDTRNSAGSILKLKEAIKNVVDWGIATPVQAIMMASLVPAISYKVDDQCGMIANGRDADLTVLEPAMELAATYLDGVERYRA